MELRRSGAGVEAFDDRKLPASGLICLRGLERQVLWLASWTIHNANYLRGTEDRLNVGGHQASSADYTGISVSRP